MKYDDDDSREGGKDSLESRGRMVDSRCWSIVIVSSRSDWLVKCNHTGMWKIKWIICWRRLRKGNEIATIYAYFLLLWLFKRRENWKMCLSLELIFIIKFTYELYESEPRWYNTTTFIRDSIANYDEACLWLLKIIQILKVYFLACI